MKQYDVAKVTAIRDDRFLGKQPQFQRNPQPGDVGTILEVYDGAFEVECSKRSTQHRNYDLAGSHVSRGVGESIVTIACTRPNQAGSWKRVPIVVAGILRFNDAFIAPK